MTYFKENGMKEEEEYPSVWCEKDWYNKSAKGPRLLFMAYL